MFSTKEEKKEREEWVTKYEDMELKDIREIDEEAHAYFVSMMTADELYEYDYELYIERRIDLAN